MIKTPRLFWSGIALGFIGCLFYANFREPKILFDFIPLFYLFTFVEQPILLPNALSEWIPSFLHIIGMSFFTAGLLKVTQNNYWKIPVIWLVIDLAFEGLQFYQTHNLLTWGDFEWVDVVAMFVSTILSIIILKKVFGQNNKIQKYTAEISTYGKYLLNVSVFSVGAFMMLGSYVAPTSSCSASSTDPTGASNLTGSYKTCFVDPIYLSWERIRASGKLLSEEYGNDYQHPLKNANKIYTYHHLLLVNEKQSGVHIFDNSNPKAPEYLDFISLIGNQDMAIKGQYLYLDSFTDLVVYNLNGINDVPIRKNNVFTFANPQDKLPSRVRFNDNGLKASNGIVIGYEDSDDQKHYFWPEFSGLEE